MSPFCLALIQISAYEELLVFIAYTLKWLLLTYVPKSWILFIWICSLLVLSCPSDVPNNLFVLLPAVLLVVTSFSEKSRAVPSDVSVLLELPTFWDT